MGLIRYSINPHPGPYMYMVFVGSNGGSNGGLVEVASCSNASNGSRMSRVYSCMTF